MYQKILIPLDGSDLAECSVQHAKAIARYFKVADVILFLAIEPPSVQSLSALVKSRHDGLRKAREHAQQRAKEYLLRIDKKLNIGGIASRAVTVDGKAAEEILDYAETNSIDLIVMSTHGRSGLSRFLFGSVAEKVSRHSRVPVLLIAPEGCRKTSA